MGLCGSSVFYGPRRSPFFPTVVCVELTGLRAEKPGNREATNCCERDGSRRLYRPRRVLRLRRTMSFGSRRRAAAVGGILL